MKHPTTFRDAWRETPPLTRAEIEEIVDGICCELQDAEVKHPGWPDDPMQQACIIAEEAGEVARAATEMVYRDLTPDQYETELRQTAAVCIRALSWIREVRGGA
jgi:hypothetical protein